MRSVAYLGPNVLTANPWIWMNWWWLSAWTKRQLLDWTPKISLGDKVKMEFITSRNRALTNASLNCIFRQLIRRIVTTSFTDLEFTTAKASWRRNQFQSAHLTCRQFYWSYDTCLSVRHGLEPIRLFVPLLFIVSYAFVPVGHTPHTPSSLSAEIRIIVCAVVMLKVTQVESF